MENNKTSKINFRSLSKNSNKSEVKNKILYKFKIIDDNRKKQKSIGKCYLINLEFMINNNYSLPKKNNKLKNLPPIKLKENNFNIITSSNLSKIGKKEDTLSSIKKNEINKSKTINLDFNYINSSINNNNERYKNNKNYYKSSISLTDSYGNLKKENWNRNNDYNNFIEKINSRYFAKFSTINYLTNLFFGDSLSHDLKYVNLSKIKGKKRKENYTNEINNLKMNNFDKYNLYFNKKPFNKKLINEKNNENPYEVFRINKSNLDEKIKKFKKMKLKKCKDLVDNAIQELKTTKENNLIYIENFRKSCDFKYEDF